MQSLKIMDLETLVSLPIEDKLLEEVAEDAKSFAFSRGMVMKAREGVPFSHAVTFVPFALFPSPFPKTQFDSVNQLQCDINTIYHRATNDFEFLRESLEHTIEVDAWTRKLWELYERTRESQKNVPSLAILRSDYMVGQDGLAKQIEVNTVSAAFGGLSPLTRELHRFVAQKLKKTGFPPENNGSNIARVLMEAWAHYISQHRSPDAVICFAVEDVVYNAYDQRQLELLLVEKFNVPAHQIVWRTNADFMSARQTDDGALFINDQEIAVFYMRTWYAPCQTPTEELWTAREIIESSRCIKCPNVAWHLVGCKKIQQELARPGVLEKFCDDAAQAERLRKVFVGLFALEEEQVHDMVLSSPEKYVLKPQREGGGNNIYGTDIPGFLKTLTEAERKEYIIMELIDTLSSKNYLVNRNKLHFTDVVNELGIFGCIFASTQEIYFNVDDCGWIFRTKDQHCKEGGVAAGYGHLDSPFLS